MKSVSFHIAYLLTRYECVIVPGLGAFVVSLSHREKTDGEKALAPPENFLGFNSEIIHNDGLLANSIAQEMSSSYREATSLIAQYVKDILLRLNEGEKVDIPWVGSLYLKDNKKIFQSEKSLSCNASNYGLDDISLPYVKDIQPETGNQPEKRDKKDKEIIWIPVSRKLIIYAGSIAAAILAMCIIPTPLNNEYSNLKHTQYASIVNLPGQNTLDVVETEDVSATEIPTPEITSSPEIATPLPEVTNPAQTETDALHYYIIIASLPDQVSAQKTLAKLQFDGFQNAAILSSDNRYRIYANRFEDKAEAEKFLIQFKEDYPAQAHAWMLKHL